VKLNKVDEVDVLFTKHFQILFMSHLYDGFCWLQMNHWSIIPQLASAVINHWPPLCLQKASVLLIDYTAPNKSSLLEEPHYFSLAGVSSIHSIIPDY